MPTLLLKKIVGANLVLRDQSQPLYRLPVTQEAALVEVWMGFADEALGQAELLGTVAPGQTLVRDLNPDFDRDRRLYLVSRGVDGARDVSLLSEAVTTLLEMRREADAPVIGQVGGAATNLVVIGVDGYTRFARLRKVEVADDEAMETGLQTTIYDSASFVSKELPRYVDITRTAGSAALTKYVRVSHSSGAAYGQASNVLMITFANAGGSGGTSGAFDPVPRGELELILD